MYGDRFKPYEQLRLPCQQGGTGERTSHPMAEQGGGPGEGWVYTCLVLWEAKIPFYVSGRLKNTLLRV